MGSVTDRSLVHLALAGPLIVMGIAALLLLAPKLDALVLGEATAQTLGVDPKQTRWLVVGGTALAVGAATAVTGIIGFVGLVVPHLLRSRVDHRPGALLLPSALGGAALVLAADIAVRLLNPMIDLRIGVLTALIGAPLFLVLAVRAGKEWRT
jgi:iron complex transport system permease protein